VTRVQNPLRINVGFLVNQPIGTNREFQLDLPDLQLEHDLNLKNFKGKVCIDRATQGLFVQGQFDATKEEQCGRCLDDFGQPLHAELSELYSFRNQIAIDTELALSEDGNIDLAPLVWEYLTLDIPMKPLCRQDCKGLCPVCGTNLNDTTCEHQANLENQTTPAANDDQ
jgi:uncharacterized protein